MESSYKNRVCFEDFEKLISGIWVGLSGFLSVSLSFRMTERSQLAAGTSPRISLFGCQVDNISLGEAVQRVEKFIQNGGTQRYFAVNVHKIVACRRSPDLRGIANRSDLVTADGQWIVWTSKWFRRPLKGRVNGTDLMECLVKLAVDKQYGIYLLGARPETLTTMVGHYQQQYPSLKILGSRNGYWSPEEESGVVQ